MRSPRAFGDDSGWAPPKPCDNSSRSVSGSDEAMEIRLRLGERGSSKPGDCSTNEESNSIGSGNALHALADAGGEPSSGPTGELSSIMSWVERFLGTRDLMANAGVA